MNCLNAYIGFSIIIPVYNVQDYLAECLYSVLNQKYENYEILLIDDGSTDKSGEICDYFAHKYNCISLIHQKNTGLSGARNAGIHKSKKNYIIFLDSDDMLCENALINLHHFICKNNSPQIILNRKCLYNGIKTTECAYFFTDDLISLSSVQAYKLVQNLQNCYMEGCMFVCRIDYLREQKLYFYEGILHEDEEWVPRIFMNAKTIGYNNSLLYCNRINRKDSITATLNIKRIKDKLKITELLQNEFQQQKYDISIKNTIFLRIQTLLFGILVDINKFNGCHEYKEVCKALKEKYSIMKKSSRFIYVISYYMLNILGVENTSKLLSYMTRLKKTRNKK